MKTLKIFSILAICLSISVAGFSQAKRTDSLKVAGECGMCKKKIEKAAKEAGASYAFWNKDTKVLVITYNSSSTNTAKIQQKIAGVGYDTPDYRADDAAYDKLDDCCKYERKPAATKSQQ